MTGGGSQSGRQLRHNSKRLLEHLRAHSRTNAAGSSVAPRVRTPVSVLARACAESASAQEEEEDEEEEFADSAPPLRGVRGVRELAPRPVVAPTYSSREVRVAAAVPVCFALTRAHKVAAYAASRLPCTYAALHRVFSEVCVSSFAAFALR